MTKLKEIFESIENDEILILSKALEFDCAVNAAHGAYCNDTPHFYNDIAYKSFKLSDLNERKIEEHINYLKMATVKAERSYCKRKQVGALLVKDNNILAEGYNGTPKGFKNDCEDCNGETHWYVQHAEANAITKMSKSTQSSIGATLYNTLCPCRECSKMLIGAEISQVYFNKIYKSFDGLELLLKAGIKVYYIPKKLL